MDGRRKIFIRHIFCIILRVNPTEAMKFPIRLWLFLAVALLPVLACESEVREANINQNKYIDDYIQQQFSDHLRRHWLLKTA